MKISLKGTSRGSSCTLKYLQIWGNFSASSPIRTRLEQLFRPAPAPPPTTTAAAPSPTPPEIPSDFLDALTYDLMLIPMLLPSGYLIDRQTLEKCVAEDQRWARAPRDPFTLTPFTETTQPVVAQQLKLRIDQFLSERNDRPEFRRHGRVLDPSNSKRRKYDHDQ